MIRVWFDTTVKDAAVRADMAAGVDWGRREMVHFVAPRRFLRLF
jgi:hypothetical protein